MSAQQHTDTAEALNASDLAPDNPGGTPEGVSVWRPVGVYCAGCGMTGYHLSMCPSLQRDSAETALGIALARIRELETDTQFLREQAAWFREQVAELETQIIQQETRGER